MIHNLSIQGLAIIDSLSIDFSKGFNVITGETGAGKSIMIRALNLLMGAKASAETVRQGFPQAVISGTFRVPTRHPACLLLANLGIPLEEFEANQKISVIVRRQVTVKGRSQSWVNDIPVTAHVCRELGATLIDVFGQHENQRLLDLASHTHYLDSFLKDQSLPRSLKRINEEITTLLSGLGELLELYNERSRDRDYLTYRLESLKEFKPNLDDFSEVSELSGRAKDQVEMRDALQASLSTLNSAGGESLAVFLREVGKNLGKKEIPILETLKDKAYELAENLDDFNYQLEKQLASLDFDETAVDEARARLAAYQDLFRKYAVLEIDALLNATQKMEEELGFIDSAEMQMGEELTKLEALTANLIAEANVLSVGRRQAAKTIKKRVEEELQDLAMKGCSFGVEFSEVKRNLAPLSFNLSEELNGRWERLNRVLSTCGEHGLERAQFLLSSNPGEPQLPLAKIASGGELSRIMLALKKTLAADADTCVLVFDEIDAGISGSVADVVGKKMQELAQDFQVICISHLPQVAVYADSHLLVHKAKKGERTETSIVKLTSDQSAHEIARLLSGEKVSETSLANARSLIKKAGSRKSKPLIEGRA